MPKSPSQHAIAHRRDLLDLTQGGLADLLREETGDDQWNRKRVHRLENVEGYRIDVDMLTALANVLDLDYATLIEGYVSRRQAGSGDVTLRYPHDAETAGQDDFSRRSADRTDLLVGSSA